MSYRERLESFEKTGLHLWKVVVAVEVDNCLDIKDDNDFENVCEFVYDWIMDTDISANELCCIISNCIDAGDLTYKDFEYDWEKCRDVINSII